MASVTRASAHLKNALIVSRTVKNGVTVTKGVGVKVGSTTHEVDLCAAGDKAYGVAQETVVGTGTNRVQVALFSGGGIIPVLITGTVNEDDALECGTAGFVARTLGGGTTLRHIVGHACDPGVTGDMIGCVAGRYEGVSS